MEESLNQKIEFIFRNSNSPEELFDTFNDAVKSNFSDFEVYKILLANPCLTIDEIKMFAGKLSRTFPEINFELFMWAAKIFENHSEDSEYIENAITYYTNASSCKPTAHEPLLEMIRLYNTELNLPYNTKILELVDSLLPTVNKKSSVYFSLAELYKKINNLNLASKYLALANIASEREGK